MMEFQYFIDNIETIRYERFCQSLFIDFDLYSHYPFNENVDGIIIGTLIIQCYNAESMNYRILRQISNISHTTIVYDYRGFDVSEICTSNIIFKCNKEKRFKLNHFSRLQPISRKTYTLDIETALELESAATIVNQGYVTIIKSLNITPNLSQFSGLKLLITKLTPESVSELVAHKNRMKYVLMVNQNILLQQLESAVKEIYIKLNLETIDYIADYVDTLEHVVTLNMHVQNVRGDEFVNLCNKLIGNCNIRLNVFGKPSYAKRRLSQINDENEKLISANRLQSIRMQLLG